MSVCLCVCVSVFLCAVPFERAVITKERLSRAYRLSAYFLAKSLTEMAVFSVLPFISVTIAYLMAGLTYQCVPHPCTSRRLHAHTERKRQRQRERAAGVCISDNPAYAYTHRGAG
jgi:hypothetical protein